jgi:hypothetical protein
VSGAGVSRFPGSSARQQAHERDQRIGAPRWAALYRSWVLVSACRPLIRVIADLFDLSSGLLCSALEFSRCRNGVYDLDKAGNARRGLYDRVLTALADQDESIENLSVTRTVGCLIRTIYSQGLSSR